MVNIKRKVIQIANSTQLVSLPRKWTLKYGIKKGDEVEVKEDMGSIIITTEKEMPSNNTEINFKGMSSLIHRALSSLYRAGYDEIKIIFESTSELEVINHTINQELIGFEILEQGKEFIVVKQVSNISPAQFDSMLRRTFLFLISTADECKDALTANNFDALKNLIIRDQTINKLTDYCRRALNKKEGYFKHLGPGYAIIELLEKIGDDYRDLCKYASDNKKKVDKPILDAIEEINLFLKQVYKLFYNFNLNEMKEFIAKKMEIDERILNISKLKNINIFLIYINSIANNIFYLNGPLMINSL